MNDQYNVTTDIEFKNYTAVPNVVWTWGLRMPTVLLLIYYLRVAGVEGECWQSLETICKGSGIGSHHTVIKARTQLVKAGLIEVSKVNADDGGIRYYVKVNALKIWKLNSEWGTPLRQMEGVSAEVPRPIGRNADTPSAEVPTKKKPIKEDSVKNKRLTSNFANEWKKFLLAWAQYFPHKVQPRVNNHTLQNKLMIRLKGKYFRENYHSALMEASGSDFVNEGSWMQAGWFLKNDENWEKCLDGNYKSNGGGVKHKSKAQQAKDANDAALQRIYAPLIQEAVNDGHIKTD